MDPQRPSHPSERPSFESRQSFTDPFNPPEERQRQVHYAEQADNYDHSAYPMNTMPMAHPGFGPSTASLPTQYTQETKMDHYEDDNEEEKPLTLADHSSYPPS